MTEEKRIFSRNGIALVGNVSGHWGFLPATRFSATPVTLSKLKDIVYTANDLDYTYSQVIYLIGLHEFWNKYGTPIKDKKWYVKVPHTTPDNQFFYYKYGIDIRPGSVRPNFMSGSESKFTEAEIKKYHLEDCEKVLTND